MTINAKKNLAMIILVVTVFGIVFVIGYFSCIQIITNQRNQQLVQISMQNQEVKNFLGKYPDARFIITEVSWIEGLESLKSVIAGPLLGIIQNQLFGRENK